MGQATVYSLIERIKVLEAKINNRLAEDLPVTKLQKEIKSLKNTCEGASLRRFYRAR